MGPKRITPTLLPPVGPYGKKTTGGVLPTSSFFTKYLEGLDKRYPGAGPKTGKKKKTKKAKIPKTHTAIDQEVSFSKKMFPKRRKSTKNQRMIRKHGAGWVSFMKE